jgi:hypothetical protein
VIINICLKQAVNQRGISFLLDSILNFVYTFLEGQEQEVIGQGGGFN